MKVFVINLDKDKDRMASIDAQLSKLGVPYERIPGVYAKEMPEAEKRKAVNRFRWWCAIGRMPRDGEIGCVLSHMKAWDRGLKDEEMICVMEDDAVVDPRFKEVTEELEKRIDKSRPQLMLLSNHRVDKGLGKWHSGFLSPKDEPFSIERIAVEFCTEGYVINRKAAEAIRRANFPMITPADHFGRWCKSGAIELYHVFPTVCSQDKDRFESETVDYFGPRVWEYGIIKWCVHKIKRLVGVSLDRILYLATAR